MPAGESGILVGAPGRGAIDSGGRCDRYARAAAWTAIALIAIGTGLRLRQYLARTSFFSDEASLVLNFRTHSAGQLVRHLDFGQAAPPVFLWVGRTMYLQFGPNEYALRLLPLIGGVLALGLFGWLAWRVLPPWAATFAIGWFALCAKLITYTAELKQYSTDVFAAVLLLWVALAWGRNQRPARRLLRLSIIAAALLWLSHPTIIVFAALAMMLLWECWKANRRSLLIGSAGCALVGASFVTLYAISIRHQHDPYLFRFWASAFPDWSKPWMFLPWLGRQSYELINKPYLGLGALLGALIALGAVVSWRRKEFPLLAACLGPVVLTVLAACARQYPFNGSRLTLFLFPGLFLMAAAGMAGLRGLMPRAWAGGWWLAGAPLIVLGLIQGGYHVLHPRYNSHIRPVVAYVRQHLRSGEAIYLMGEMGPPGGPLLSPGWHHEFLAYWPDPPAIVHTQLDSVRDIHEKRFWVALAFRPHVKTAQRLFGRIREVADPIGKPFIVKEGGAACLFELRTFRKSHS